MNTSSILSSGLEQFSIQRPEAESSNNELGQNQFLELMLVQLQHQDPLNPMESGDFLAQLAQFGTVEGITGLQESFDSFSSSFQSSSALQASTMVGRSVLISGQEINIDSNNNTLDGAVELNTSTPSLNVQITDSIGRPVKFIELGTQAAGLVKFNWDGLDENGDAVEPGNYFIQAIANVDNTNVAQPTLVSANVDSVTISGNNTLLNLEGLGTVALGEVREIK